MVFLSVITRHLTSRKAFLAENQASLAGQSDPDYVQVLVIDEIGRGIPFTHEYLARNDWNLDSQYVMLLDDDNVLERPDFIERLKALTADLPGAVFWRVEIPDLGIIPNDDHWQTVTRAQIDANGAAVRLDVWMEGIKEIAPRYDGDYDYLKACHDLAGSVVWDDSLNTRALRRSLGAA